MRSFKSFLVLGLMILLIGFTSNCKNIFGPDIDIDNGDNGDNGEEQKFAFNVEVIYERTEPYVSSDTVNLNIETEAAGPVEDWESIHWVTMEKISDQQFKYVAEKLPADVKLYACVQDYGKSNAGGLDEFNPRIIIVNGTELTDIRDHPTALIQVAYFTIKEDGTVVP